MRDGVAEFSPWYLFLDNPSTSVIVNLTRQQLQRFIPAVEFITLRRLSVLESSVLLILENWFVSSI